MRVVVALGGNALLRRGEPMTEEVQRRNVQAAAAAIAEIAREHETVVTHGNGPQVGLLALESEAYKEVPPYGLDVLGAESQGMIGFMLEQALRNQLSQTAVATLLTSVLVDLDDPAFAHPSKPIGPVYTSEVAHEIAQARGWSMAPDGAGFRRIVPSPRPRRVIELEAVQVMVAAGILVICAGGGGVPVARMADGSLDGVEGVIDKDMTSALLAEELGADALLLLTDVAAVQVGWGTADARPLHETTPAELARYQFAAGSMGPKVEAACRFVERARRVAAIGALSDAKAMLCGRAGTIVRPE
ncbi:MAG TPA: carbamate kinase [Dehalococcoidia bacterium]|nr:carbamate kinase [Dehalococcoidia bacterium]